MSEGEIQRREVLILPEELRNRCGVRAGEKVIVGVSGGSDSLALLLTLKELGVDVFAAHFDHRLREESGADAEWVREFCVEREIPVAVAVGNVHEAAEKFGKSIEETARHLRYHFMFMLAEREKASAVAVGHHADDQVETVLMNILRGTGIEGLSGIRPRRFLSEYSREIPLIRPFLTTKREAIAAWLEKQGVHPLVDASNNDLTFTRNRIRHELIPYLKKYFNPNLPDAILRMRQALALDRDYLDIGAKAAMAQIGCGGFKGAVYFRRERYLTFPIPIRHRLLRRILSEFGELKNGLPYDAFQLIEAFFADDESAKEALRETVLANGRMMFKWRMFGGVSIGAVDRQKLYALEMPSLAGETIQSFPLFLNESHYVGNIMIRIGTSAVENGAEREKMVAEMRNEPHVVYLDEAGLDGNLIVRTKASGERFIPFGMRGTEVSLADFMLNRKIPSEARAVYPIVCDDRGPVWVLGLRTAERVKVHDGTKRVIRIDWRSRGDFDNINPVGDRRNGA